MGNERTDRELDVFHLFARAAGLCGCAKKRDPPEPDVLLYDPSGSPTAFELVELLDQDYGRRLGLLFGTKTALRTYYENLPIEKKALFDRKYGNALLYFRFLPELTFNRRRRSLPTVFEGLLALSDDFVGEALEDDPTLAEVLSGVSVSRGRFVGPVLDSESVGWVGDPTVLAVAQKFSKRYQTPYPIDLLAYIDINPMFPEEVWISDLEEYLRAQPRPWPFRRVWVFEAKTSQIKYQYE